MEIKIDSKEYNLPEEIASNISNQFKPMLDKMVELEKDFNEIIKLPIEEEETQIKAKELRMRYVKIRTGTSEIHKQQKAFYLSGGRFVDGWKNAQLFASQGKEEKLEEIEKYAENIAKKKFEELYNQRAELIKPYVDELVSELGYMDEDVFQAYLTVKKKAYEEKKEEQKKIQEEQEKLKRIQNLHNSRKEELLEYWQFMDITEKTQNLGILSDKYYDGLLFSIKTRKANHDAEQKLLRKQLEEKEALLSKQREIEEKAKKEAIKLAKAPIKKQLMSWAESFNIPEPPNDDLGKEIYKKFQSFKNWSLKQIESYE